MSAKGSPRKKVTDEDVKKLALDIKEGFSIKSKSTFPKRPGYGSLGRVVKVYANHFPIKFKNINVHKYDVEFEIGGEGQGDAPVQASGPFQHNKRFRKLWYQTNREVFEAMVNLNKDTLFKGINPVYDGQKIMFTSKKLNLPAGELRLRVPYNDNGKLVTYFIILSPTAVIQLNDLVQYLGDVRGNLPIPQDAIQAIDIILRHGPTIQKIPIGASLFSSDQASRFPLGGGRQIAFGHYQSVRPTQCGLTLNVDRSVTAFYAANSIVNFFEEFLNSQQRRDRQPITLTSLAKLNDQQRKELEKELKTMQVVTSHLGYKKKNRVIGISKETPRDLKFQWIKRNPDGTEVNKGMVTVEKYFLDEYRIRLRLSHMPCLIVGNPNKKNHLPIEVCDLVENQHVRRKLTGEQTAEMIRHTATQGPAARFNHISNSVNEIINESRPYLNEFGINISQNYVQLDSRILDPPALLFRNNITSPVIKGKWDFQRVSFYTPSALTEWICVNNIRARNAERFIDALYQKAIAKGMTIKPCKQLFEWDQRENTEIMFQRVLKSFSPSVPSNQKLIVFLIHEKSDRYHEIKYIGDIRCNISTQCVIPKNVDRFNDQIITNILIKINSKLGGKMSIANKNSPNFPRIMKERLMVVAADVTHPAPADQISASVAALVGSYDPNCSHYNSVVKVQRKTREETMTGVDEMMKQLLVDFKNKNGWLPPIIIFYRDGVSEGQFTQVLNFELNKIKEMCARLEPNYNPKISFIVVQKRHHTRFRVVDERNKNNVCGRHNNILPGTVVDSVITHKTDHDFYLCSHEGIQGTSRPTHYYTLYDDNNLGANELQLMTYYLCHMYNRCPRSVSIPAPVYYADLAAFRARQWIIGREGNYDQYSATSEEQVAHVDSLNEGIEILNNEYRSRPYFC